MSQIEIIVDEHIWDISKGLFSFRTYGIDSVVWYAVFQFLFQREQNHEYPPPPLITTL